ncbi:hypothetical protein B5X24_HaOG215747 [Helicoverpa armigera]|nr:hypothetical protein B5X24_HaOG215747 [Helicoverpa armigera]
MSALLIIFATIAVGKIHGQEPVVSQVTNVRPSSVPAFYRRPVYLQEHSAFGTSQPPPRLYTNAPRPADRELPRITSGINLNLASSTVGQNQPQRKLFVSKVPNEKNRPLNGTITMNTEYNVKENDVYEDITFEKNKPPGSATNPGILQESHNVKIENVTKVKPVNENITNDGIVPKVSLDERSSFNGNECPVGFVKVNGQCVKAD